MTVTTISQSYELLRVGFKREDAQFCYRHNYSMERADDGCLDYKELPGYFVDFNRDIYADATPAWSIDQLWEEVHKLDYIYDFDSTQSAVDLIADLVEIIVKAREGNNV